MSPASTSDIHTMRPTPTITAKLLTLWLEPARRSSLSEDFGKFLETTAEALPRVDGGARLLLSWLRGKGFSLGRDHTSILAAV